MPEVIYTPNSIRTYTGKVFDLEILDPESICIEDIAHALSLTARYGGHTQKLYSVAQHSVLVAERCPDSLILQGLLHDASEAYIGDMPSPFKKMMPDFKNLENKLMETIALKFGFDWPEHPQVKEIDREMLYIEFNALHLSINTRKLMVWSSEESEKKFLDFFHSIMLNQH